MKNVYCMFVAGLIYMALPGCGDSTPITNEPPPKDAEAALKELAQVYRYIQHQRGRVPSRAEDLYEYEGSLPIALPMVISEDIVVRWGVGYTKGSTDVLAYDKGTPDNGGPVLVRDCEVKTMTAEEFKSAKK